VRVEMASVKKEHRSQPFFLLRSRVISLGYSYKNLMQTITKLPGEYFYQTFFKIVSASPNIPQEKGRDKALPRTGQCGADKFSFSVLCPPHHFRPYLDLKSKNFLRFSITSNLVAQTLNIDKK